MATRQIQYGFAFIGLFISKAALGSGTITNFHVASFLIFILIIPLCLMTGLYIALKKATLKNLPVAIMEVTLIISIIFGCTDFPHSKEEILIFIMLITLTQFFLFSPFAIKQIAMRWNIDRIHSEYSRMIVFKCLSFLVFIVLFFVYSLYSYRIETVESIRRSDIYFKTH